MGCSHALAAPAQADVVCTLAAAGDYGAELAVGAVRRAVALVSGGAAFSRDVRAPLAALYSPVAEAVGVAFAIFKATLTGRDLVPTGCRGNAQVPGSSELTRKSASCIEDCPQGPGS